jgi:hypothetical protein
MRSLSLAIVEQQSAYLEGLSDGEFLFAVAGALKALEADPRIEAHLSDLCHEADDLGRQLHEAEYDDGSPGRTLDHVWDELGRRLPDPQHGELIKMTSRFRSLLGDLHHPVVVPLDPNGGEDDSRIGRLVRMVESLDVSAGSGVLDDWRTALENVRKRQEGLHLRQLRLTRTHAGVSLLRLRCLAGDEGAAAAAEVGSCPRLPEDRPALVVRADAGGRSWGELLDLLLTGERELNEITEAPKLVEGMRGAVARLVLELNGRIGTVRSRLAMVDRYKARCEWHDRERLFELAAEATGARESALRDEMALYLFDNGLDPISEASIGSHSRADVFHAAPHDSFLLEAKQYSDGASLTAALRGAFRQALDTAGNLRGSGYEADEAFIVLFRRGGPRAILPSDSVEADGLAWYFRLINIAPPGADASRNKQTPIEYTADDLRSMLFEVRTADLSAPDVEDAGGAESDHVK